MTTPKPAFANTAFQPHLSRRQQKKALFEKAAREQAGYANDTAFRRVERQYRSRVPPPDLTDVLDFRPGAPNTPALAARIVPIALDTEDSNGYWAGLGASPPTQGYMVRNFPGLIVIPGCFAPDVQRRLIKDCLRRYAVPPAKSNLDALYLTPPEGLWNRYKREGAGEAKPEPVTRIVPTPATEKGKEDEPTAVTAGALIPRLRWVTLGYQYNWSAKEYFLDAPQPFPAPIGQLARAVVGSIHDVGYVAADGPDLISSPRHTWLSSSAEPADEPTGYVHRYDPAGYEPEAGVINFYQARDSLMAHVDRSEQNMEAPLVSVSLGNTAIFVIGDESRDTPPLSMYLRSGDIVCMCGPRRRALHGIPRVLEDTLPDYLTSTDDVLAEDFEWDSFAAYMTTTRININVRQVFNKDRQPPSGGIEP
ncbi:hypothetical protein IWQ60_003597 [Tieghemiomyces parasiticus]|uniref:Fe2OG dioxygenase domain-containing protein n=1 Tax=Tieghemiomyces parasiticus TaxID=78921 RepID=A0A9W8ACX9_9FUNG|nr:hypothetical protein IWQ60_003597 [Tieghemiomyces parasiticus]